MLAPLIWLMNPATYRVDSSADNSIGNTAEFVVVTNPDITLPFGSRRTTLHPVTPVTQYDAYMVPSERSAIASTSAFSGKAGTKAASSVGVGPGRNRATPGRGVPAIIANGPAT